MPKEAPLPTLPNGKPVLDPASSGLSLQSQIDWYNKQNPAPQDYRLNKPVPATPTVPTVGTGYWAPKDPNVIGISTTDQVAWHNKHTPTIPDYSISKPKAPTTVAQQAPNTSAPQPKPGYTAPTMALKPASNAVPVGAKPMAHPAAAPMHTPAILAAKGGTPAPMTQAAPRATHHGDPANLGPIHH